MVRSSFQLREAFHLLILKFLSESLAVRSYAVKGGICLRFFHRSPRLSEDLDLDIAGIPVETFRGKVRKLLKSQPFLDALQGTGLVRLSATEPKQTETTQRWKVHLILTGGNRLITRLECSRRSRTLCGMEKGVPSPEVLLAHQMTPFVCCYYGPEAMVRQKVAALASSSRSACRDLFDLHHLVTHAAVRKGLVQSFPEEIRHRALEKIESFTVQDFREQVVPFLPPDWVGLAGNSTKIQGWKSEVQFFLESA